MSPRSALDEHSDESPYPDEHDHPDHGAEESERGSMDLRPPGKQAARDQPGRDSRPSAESNSHERDRDRIQEADGGPHVGRHEPRARDGRAQEDGTTSVAHSLRRRMTIARRIETYRSIGRPCRSLKLGGVRTRDCQG